MITFSCKKISQEELIRCAFGLNKTAYNLLMFLLKNNKEYTASQIARLMKLDRTTIQKAVSSLADKGLAKRIQTNLPKGSYTFRYQINGKEEIKNKIKTIINKWCRSAEEAINNL